MRDRFDQHGNSPFTFSSTQIGSAHGERSYLIQSRIRDDVVRPTWRDGFKTPTYYGCRTASVRTEGFTYLSHKYGETSVSGRSAPVSDFTGVRQGIEGNPDTNLWQPLYKKWQKDITLEECLAKISQSDFNLGVALAEAGQTVDLVASNTIKVLRAYRYVRKKQYYRAYRALGLPIPKWKNLRSRLSLSSAKAWLQLQFGWLPLISDIYGAIESLRKDWALETPILSSVRRKSFDNTDLARYGAEEYYAGGDIRTTMEAKYFYTIDDKIAYILNSLGLTNPLAIGWERIPFSFVVDWFVSVGTFLTNMTGWMGTKYLSGYITIHNMVRDLTIEYHIPPFNRVSGTLPRFTVSAVAWRRFTFPFAPPVRGVPRFRLRFNKRKALSGIALITQARSK